MKNKKKTKVYLIDLSRLTRKEERMDLKTISDNKFCNIAERQGNIYSLPGFEYVFNEDKMNLMDSFIRIINQ